MKKILIIGILAFMLIMPIIGATNTTNETLKSKNSNFINGEDFTHTVGVEYVTTTNCGYCPTASNQLNSIYNSGDYDFYFVTFVSDQNSWIWSRVQELGTLSVPDVFFDGGFVNLVGAQVDETPYRNAIVNSGERIVPDLDMDVSVDFMGGGTLKINVDIQNNEAEDYNGILKVYVVEKESRWNDVQGHPYHFGALGIPIDDSLAVPQGHPTPIGDSYNFKKTWFGAIFGFSDITEDNIMVIAVIYDSETGYAVQTAAAEPTSTTPQFHLFENIKFFQLIKEKNLIFKILDLIEKI